MVNEYWKKRIKAEQLAKIERDASLGDEFNVCTIIITKKLKGNTSLLQPLRRQERFAN